MSKQLSYFIADLHLSEGRPDIFGAFLDFLQNQALAADALYILGDLFEFWVGDDTHSEQYERMAHALAHLHAQGVRCYFIQGNRDFLIGKGFAKRCKLELLPSETLIDLYGKRVLILHGDTLCTDDIAYQKFRAHTQKRWLRRCFLALPIKLRERIAQSIRGKTVEAKQSKSMAIMDVNHEAVNQRFREQRLDYMIHGHTHRPAIHHIEGAAAHCHRIVLGDWHHHPSILAVSPDGLTLEFEQKQLRLKL